MNRILNCAVMIGLLMGWVGSEASAQQSTRVGVDAAKTRLLTLRDAITAALENNRDIAIERINVQITFVIRPNRKSISSPATARSD